MEVLKPVLKSLVKNSEFGSKPLKMNLLKECLQVSVLDFVYSNKKYNKLFFYGGSCLAQCFGLNRLSEDLDFVDSGKSVDIQEMGRDLVDYFNNNTDLEVEVYVQKFRIYLKFPILDELGLSHNMKDETNLLILKIEIFSDFNFCEKYSTEIRPIFRFNKSILVKTFDLSTLMSTKIRAVLNRKWEKLDKSGEVIIRVKGRDYFDLLWYLEKGVIPNLECIEDVKDMNDLKKRLVDIVSSIDKQSIKLDLEAFIDNNDFVDNISNNLKDILIRSINERL